MSGDERDTRAEGERAPKTGDHVESQIEPAREVRIVRPAAVPQAELGELRDRSLGPLPPFRYRNAYALGLCDAGESELLYAGKRLDCASGFVAVSRPFESARVVRRCSPEVRVRVVMLDPAMIEAALSGIPERWRRESAAGYLRATRPQLGESIRRFFTSIAEPEASLLQQAAAWDCAEQVATLYAEADLPEPAASPEHVRRAREFLHAHFSEDIDLNMLAAATGNLHPRYLLALFKQAVNIPPHQYVLHLRVNAACELIRDGRSAAQAGRAVGFYDSSQLHRHFVRIMGVTPGAYARACK